MLKPRTLLLSLAISLSTLSNEARAQKAPGWPQLTRENKPWTRWWWPGSAVDKASITHQMEQMAKAGLGGVEITPIYGAKGYESRYIDFLSPKWMEMLEHVGKEGKRLGLGVDMATGTGWPFGGPWIDSANALASAVLQDGKLTGKPTKMLVKRAAPGNEGLVVDPYSPDALRRYLAPFDKAFASFPKGMVRGQFHDSFEYYGGSWTPKFAQVFSEMHGYDIQQYAADLLAKPADVSAANRAKIARIKADFRETLGRLHLDYLRTWVAWSHSKGFIVRNQSHGAPANILDLYANADIAETEVFGSTPFKIPGLRRLDNEVRHDQDLPEPLVIRMASSAGHVVGHNLSSSETCTWLRDHWKEALAYAKPEIDRIFADGINHVFYHGTVFSPQDAPWPGWLFYASTQFQPNNTIWQDFSALNQYVGRVQSILQRGKPDNDVLLYWPLADVWENENGLMTQLGVHNVKWLTEQPVGKLAQAMMDRGYSFDYISDAQLQQTRADAKQLATPGSRYKVLVVPATQRMPLGTLQRLKQLADGGATIIFQAMPEDVPGFGRLEARRADFKTLLGQFAGKAVVKSDVLAVLESNKVPREAIADAGISFIRRAGSRGHDYFITNLTGKNFDGWATIGVPAQSAVIRDPLSGRTGFAALKSAGTGAQVYLQLAPGESLLLETNGAPAPPAQLGWAYRQPTGTPTELKGTWQIQFIKGGPELPKPITTSDLKSWTELGGDEAKRFAGTARYRLEWDAPTQKADDWLLDLGEVRESARIRLNGRDVATAWSIPFQVRIGEYLKPGKNILELEVTNLAANRIRDMDQRKVDWKIMREINFVDINYKPFDASGWEITPSGLIGPVRLQPLKKVTP
ncbi:hypothetical protein EXU57_14720 [Segetibacter sp. 3557_3]|uniref:glycosyl hydrolase n=1 Tax=Segetibacter sp. 3557_3 TaxID=2547429 RepID=UPI001058BE47|nr:glycosyl hydrolase [Segetibacter sp. 3557_3]TDH24591.1 hypothetical protein EXU57_14720 [Segetibacter sp. 3557_3]